MRSKSLILSLGLATASIASTADAGNITNWFADPAATITGAATNSPTLGDGTTNSFDNRRAAAIFGTAGSKDTVELEIGETLTVSMQMTLVGGIGNSSNLRFGVFDDNGQIESGNVSGMASGYSLFLNVGLRSIKTNGNFGSNGDFIDVPGKTYSPSGVLSGNAPSDPYTWTFVITRDSATTVDLSSTFANSAYSLTSTAEDVTATSFKFNSVGMLFGGSADMDQVIIGDAQYNVVPEPTSLALIGMGGLAFLRRRRQA